MKRSIAGLATLILCLLSTSALEAASRPALSGTGGAVVSDEYLATLAGLGTLAQGGNAVDAAVATALALAVVSPEAGNLGGGGFAVVKFGDDVAFLDFREVAPAAAHRELYLDDDGKVIPEASIIGPLAAGVPGSPDGLHALHRRFGKLPWKTVVEPAIRLAIDGFPISQRMHNGLEREKEMLSRFPESARVWLDGDGEPLPAGLRLRLPDLARTLERYANDGPAGVTEGPVAEAVVEVSKRHGGIFTLEDLADYEPVWREPVRFEAFGWQVVSAALPSSGGILLGSSATVLEGLDLGAAPRFGADRHHLLAEAWRRAYADRFLLGDPSTTQADMAQLLDPEYLKARTASVDRQRASASDSIDAWTEKATVEGVEESKDTTHLSVVDADGNLVALTTTINGLFGCGLYVPGAGFFLNNEMDDFAAAPGQPNLYGLVQGEANAVGAGKRMLSSMSPTIAWKDERAIALGGRGGSRIPTATLQVMLNVIVDGDGLQEAVDRPRVHHQWLPDTLEVEPDAASPETRAALAERGHTVGDRGSIAQVHAVGWDDGTVEAAADPRGGAGHPGVVKPKL